MNKFAIGFFLICIISFPDTYGSIDSLNITKKDNFSIHKVKKFTFSYKVEDNNLFARVSCTTKGWVAVAFKPTKKMKDANMVIGCNKNGIQIVEDHFGVSKFSHKADTLIGGKNNLLESSCTEENGVTTLSFTIPLNSNDEKDVELKIGEEIMVLFAAGKKDNFKTKHFIIAKQKILF